MNIFLLIAKSIYSPVGVIKCEKIEDRFIIGNLVFLISCIINAFIFPIVYYLYFKNKYDIHLEDTKMLLIFSICIVTFFLECIMFWLVSVFFKKKTSLKEIIAIWGVSLFSNIFCVTIYLLSLIFNSIIVSRPIFMFTLNTIYIMLLIWKTIYYFIVVNLILKLKVIETMIATVLIWLGIFILMIVGFAVGIQVPVV